MLFRSHSDVRDWVSSTETPFSAYFDRRGEVTLRDLPCPYLCVNFLPQDVTRLNGPTRQIPGTQNSRANIPGLPDEPEWMRLSTVCPVPAGSIMLRDTRAWHGGTPNVSDATRSIPQFGVLRPVVQGAAGAGHQLCGLQTVVRTRPAAGAILRRRLQRETHYRHDAARQLSETGQPKCAIEIWARRR